MKLGKPWIL